MPSSVQELTLVYHGFKSLPKVVELDSNPFEATIQEEKNGSFSFKVTEGFKQITLRWG